MARGNITSQEAARLIGARNQLLLRIRAHLSPWGQLYSEILKPRASLPDLDSRPIPCSSTLTRPS